MPSIRTADYSQEVALALSHATSLDAGVAFASLAGLDFRRIGSELEKMLQNGGQARILVDLSLGSTHPDFLERVLSWQDDGLKVSSRHYEASHGIFHPKTYLFRLQDGSVRVVTGSANWTREAFSTNVEHGVVLEGAPSDATIADVQQFFEELWGSDNAKVIDSSVLSAYRPYWRKWRGLERKSKRRTTGTWGRLRNQLEAESHPTGFRWPSREAAFLIGVVTARGSIDRNLKKVSIRVRYGGQAYRHNGQQGYVGKGSVSFDAESVAPLVPQAIVERVSGLTLPSVPSIQSSGSSTYTIDVGLSDNPWLQEALSEFFGRYLDYRQFRVPRQILSQSDRDLQEEFIRGYALACALASSGTYGPGAAPLQQVWLRPATENHVQYNQIAELLEKSFGIVTYKHRRSQRDVAIKVRCEDWLDIGFGVDWLDAIVEEGARMNGALGSPQVP